jgi:hypothetical protein
VAQGTTVQHKVRREDVSDTNELALRTERQV